jgi:hypothetical protein
MDTIDTPTLIRVVAGALFVILFLILIQRRKKRIR